MKWNLLVDVIVEEIITVGFAFASRAAASSFNACATTTEWTQWFPSIAIEEDIYFTFCQFMIRKMKIEQKW